jgi:hypothetical protein
LSLRSKNPKTSEDGKSVALQFVIRKRACETPFARADPLVRILGGVEADEISPPLDIGANLWEFPQLARVVVIPP